MQRNQFVGGVGLNIEPLLAFRSSCFLGVRGSWV
jgi:hypothetical protein